MSRITHFSKHASIALATLALAATATFAQSTAAPYKRDIPAKLARNAKVSEDSASKIAQAKFPNGTIEAVELENENGHLQYSYDIKVAGKAGIEEVNVNAKNGHVIGVAYETAATGRKETAAEKMEKKKP